MDGRQRRGQDLLRLEQVMDVGARVVRAGVALAALDEGCEITLETRVRDVEAPIGRVDRCVSCHSRGVDAVKGVGTGCDTCEEILGF